MNGICLEDVWDMIEECLGDVEMRSEGSLEDPLQIF